MPQPPPFTAVGKQTISTHISNQPLHARLACFLHAFVSRHESWKFPPLVFVYAEGKASLYTFVCSFSSSPSSWASEKARFVVGRRGEGNCITWGMTHRGLTLIPSCSLVRFLWRRQLYWWESPVSYVVGLLLLSCWQTASGAAFGSQSDSEQRRGGGSI
jgi:hypothetical protein